MKSTCQSKERGKGSETTKRVFNVCKVQVSVPWTKMFTQSAFHYYYFMANIKKAR